MANKNIKSYLDYTGLSKFWDQIKEYFVNSEKEAGRVGYANEAELASRASQLANPIIISAGTDGTMTSGVISGKTENWSGDSSITIPIKIKEASASNEGLMTATQYEKLRQLQPIYNIDADSKLSINSNTLTIDLTDYALKNDLSSVFKFKGTVESVTYLNENISNPEVGDVYHVLGDQHKEYVYVKGNGDASDSIHGADHWEELGVNVNLSEYLTVESATAIYATKEALQNLELPHTKISDWDTTIANSTVAKANSTEGTLIVKLTSETKTFNGAKDVEVDLSGIATTEGLEKLTTRVTTLENNRAKKLTSAANGHILVADANGDLADSDVDVVKLTDGAIAAGNENFVTGTQVNSVISDVTDSLKAQTDTRYVIKKESTGEGAPAGVFTVVTTQYDYQGNAVTGAGSTTYINTGAQANVIESISATDSNSSTIDATITEKKASLDLSSFALSSDLTSITTSEIEALFSTT